MVEPVRLPSRPADLDALPPVAVRDAADFAEIVAAGEPAIIKGLFATWPALAAGMQAPATLNAYFKRLDRGAPVPVMEAPARHRGQFAYGPDLREFTFTKRTAPLGPTLDRIESLIGQDDGPTVAIQMLRLDQAMPDFVAQNPLPVLADVPPRLWLGGAVHTRTHNDRDDNLACVIAGRRRFVLFPPEQVSNLYVGPPDNPPPLSLVDPEAPDFARFPRYRDAIAAARVAFLEPGDALFMPRYWWHHVTSLDPHNAMVNYWWGGSDEPNDAFLTAILAFRDLPPHQRDYWREMIAAYVFDERGDVVSHLPYALRGALGAMTPARRAALRQQLAKPPQ
ncbi:cupin-like domain-containing protein [Sphingomonas panacisoli]|uniref:Cupin-like domain-containing protein n=1 Tax=Sphingomonas panacisoli TaxID=1813879 RepID=A0A5B8LKZ4_9SPHN|nr:cupin-like domain-containing protein [Sphingomonas panacisoli]QDZ08252.1 cupin-like domain-containing protein [Sphingomonas panacisoli]